MTRVFACSVGRSVRRAGVGLLAACALGSAFSAEPESHRLSAQVNYGVGWTGPQRRPGDACTRSEVETPNDSAVRRLLKTAPLPADRRVKASGGSALYTPGTPGATRLVSTHGRSTLTSLITDGVTPTVLGGILDEDDAGGRRSLAVVAEFSDVQTQEARDLLELAALEHLYALVLEREPVGTFSFAGVHMARGQWEVLRSIGVARECVAARLGAWAGSRAIRLWHTAALRWDDAATLANGHGTDRVAVQVVHGRGAPVPSDATVTFFKAPHMVCTAKIDISSSRAACTLWDLHGHDESHEHEDSLVVATYSGSLARTWILLPTAAIFGDR